MSEHLLTGQEVSLWRWKRSEIFRSQQTGFVHWESDRGLGFRTVVRIIRSWTGWTETGSWSRSKQCLLSVGSTVWYCGVIERAPALQESGQNHTSAASGVAHAEPRGATNGLNWTEVGPKARDEPLSWRSFFVHSFRFRKSVLASPSRRRGLGC